MKDNRVKIIIYRLLILINILLISQLLGAASLTPGGGGDLDIGGDQVWGGYDLRTSGETELWNGSSGETLRVTSGAGIMYDGDDGDGANAGAGHAIARGNGSTIIIDPDGNTGTSLSILYDELTAIDVENMSTVINNGVIHGQGDGNTGVNLESGSTLTNDGIIKLYGEGNVGVSLDGSTFNNSGERDFSSDPSSPSGTILTTVGLVGKDNTLLAESSNSGIIVEGNQGVGVRATNGGTVNNGANIFVRGTTSVGIDISDSTLTTSGGAIRIIGNAGVGIRERGAVATTTINTDVNLEGNNSIGIDISGGTGQVNIGADVSVTGIKNIGTSISERSGTIVGDIVVVTSGGAVGADNRGLVLNNTTTGNSIDITGNILVGGDSDLTDGDGIQTRGIESINTDIVMVGQIVVNGADSEGINISGGSFTNTTTASVIQVMGADAVGINANNADINLAGGVVVEGADVVGAIIDGGSFTTTSTVSSINVNITSGDGSAVIGRNDADIDNVMGIILTGGGANTQAFLLEDGSDLDNAGAIFIDGDSVRAIVSEDGNSTIVNSGTIVKTSNNGEVVSLEGIGTTFTNSGVIRTEGTNTVAISARGGVGIDLTTGAAIVIEGGTSQGIVLEDSSLILRGESSDGAGDGVIITSSIAGTEAIIATTNSSVILEAESFISLGGGESTGLILDNGSELTSEAVIEMLGIESIGIQVLDAGGIVTLGEDSTISVTGKDSKGVEITSGDVENAGLILVSAANSTEHTIGIEVLNENGSAITTSTSAILIDGTGVTAMKVSDGGSIINNGTILGRDIVDGSGTVVTAGANQRGLWGKSTTTNVAISNGEDGFIQLVGDASIGILVDAEGGDIENAGTISLSGGTKSSGIFATGVDSVENAEDAVIEVHGNESTGVLLSGITSFENAGTISVSGKESVAIKAYGVDNLTTEDGNIILQSGEEMLAIDSDSSTVELDGSVELKNAKGSGVMKARAVQDDLINNSNVTVEGLIESSLILVEAGMTADILNTGDITVDDSADNQSYKVVVIDGDGATNIENSGDISLMDIGGKIISSTGSEKIVNSGDLDLDGIGQVAIYTENEDVEIEQTGKITLSGERGIAFDVNEALNEVVNSYGDIEIASGSTGSMVMYARGTIKKAENFGDIVVDGADTAAILGGEGTTLINNGTLEVNNKDSFGIQGEGDADVIITGDTKHTVDEGVIVYLGSGDNNLFIDADADVDGRVLATAGGEDTYYGTDIGSSGTLHRIDYSLEGFAHMKIEDGDFVVEKNGSFDGVYLEVPKEYIDKSGPSSSGFTSSATRKEVEDYTGSLTIDNDAFLLMEVAVNDNFTTTVKADKLTIDGEFIYAPIDPLYITNDDVILVPNVETNEVIEGHENVSVIGVVEGWEGSYELSEDGTDMSLRLDRIYDSGGINLPPSYRDGLVKYPQTTTTKLMDMESKGNKIVDTTIAGLEEIHNGEIPYSFDYSSEYKTGNVKPKKGDDYKYGKLETDSYFAYKYDDRTVAAINFGYGRTTSNFSTNNSKEVTTDYTMSLALSKEIEEVIVTPYAVGTLFKSDVDREVSDHKYIASSSQTSHSAKLGVNISNIDFVDDHKRIKRAIDLGIQHYKADSISEDGNAYYTMEIEGASKIMPVIGAEVVYEKEKENFTQVLGLRIDHNFASDGLDRQAHFTFEPNVKYTMTGVSLPDTTLTARIGGRYHMTSRLLVHGNIDLLMNTVQTGIGVGGGFTYEF